MPILRSSYQPTARLLRNGHLQTIAPSLLRRVPGVTFTRERLPLDDGDFLDLDWIRSPHATHLAILSHGLEGSTEQAYIRGMARALARRGWDVLAWNHRGCSGEPNAGLRMYHSGVSDDLHAVLRRGLQERAYTRVGLVGFSLGANVTLKFLGEQGASLDPQRFRAAVFSAPCDLEGCCRALARRSNALYMEHFLLSLRRKVATKKHQFPHAIDDRGLWRVRTFFEFDDRFTAPLHGFDGALDYYTRASSGPLLPEIRVPTLLVNAADDPFLSPSCYPRRAARNHPWLHLEIPRHGGHVGFLAAPTLRGDLWSERRAAEFLSDDRVAQRSSETLEVEALEERTG